MTNQIPGSSSEPLKIKRIMIRVEFADDSVQEFTSEEPHSASLTVGRPSPGNPAADLDLSRIPVTGGHTITLTFTTRMTVLQRLEDQEIRDDLSWPEDLPRLPDGG